MKMFYVLLVCSVFTSQPKAQTNEIYHRFRVDAAIGINVHSKDEQLADRTGLVFAIEPKYALHKNLLAGLRLALRFDVKPGGFAVPTFQGSGSYLITADYYLSEHRAFRAFAGAGTGLFKVDDDVFKLTQGTLFGGMIRSGIEANHFRLAVEYNLTTHASFTTLHSYNYFAITVGIALGGGRKKSLYEP